MYIDKTGIIMTYVNMGIIILAVLGVIFWTVKKEKNKKNS